MAFAGGLMIGTDWPLEEVTLVFNLVGQVALVMEEKRSDPFFPPDHYLFLSNVTMGGKTRVHFFETTTFHEAGAKA